MHQVALTITEACAILQPPISERQLRAIVRALAIPPAGTRRNGRSGHPQHTYDWAQITRLHGALEPWLPP